MKTIRLVLILLLPLSSYYSCNADNDKDVIIIESQEEFNKLIKGDKPVLVDYYADWCKPCRIQGPIVSEIATEKKTEIIVAKLDVDEFPRIASRYQIRNIPTLMIFQSNEVKWKEIGLKQKAEIIAAINARVED